MDVDHLMRNVMEMSGIDSSKFTDSQLKAMRVSNLPPHVEALRAPIGGLTASSAIFDEVQEFTQEPEPMPEPKPLIFGQHKSEDPEPAKYWHLFGGFDDDLYATALVGPADDKDTLTGQPVRDVRLPIGDADNELIHMATFDHYPTTSEMDTFQPDGYASTDGSDVFSATGTYDPGTGTLRPENEANAVTVITTPTHKVTPPSSSTLAIPTGPVAQPGATLWVLTEYNPDERNVPSWYYATFEDAVRGAAEHYEDYAEFTHPAPYDEWYPTEFDGEPCDLATSDEGHPYIRKDVIES